MKYRSKLVAVAGLLATSGLAVIPPATAQTTTMETRTVSVSTHNQTVTKKVAYTRAQRTARAQKVQAMPFEAFRKLRVKYTLKKPTGIDATLNWTKGDCSVPAKWIKRGEVVGVETWMGAFRAACERHDFGYRNFGKGYAKGYAFISSNDQKLVVDNQFHTDMKTICKTSGTGKACTIAAKGFYTGVRSKDSHVAWHNSECHANKLCLFDDDNYKGKRFMFSTYHTNLDDFEGFGDEADSARSTATYYWKVFADKSGGGQKLCIVPNQRIPDLDQYGMGDKIHSIGNSRTC